MRGGVAETQEQPGGQSEDRIISYDYDELNRLTGESADCNGDGYTADYVYDLVGNRLERTITVGAQTLITTSSFDDSDRLESEVHEGPVWAMVVDDRPVYAYASDGGGVSYRGAGGREAAERALKEVLDRIDKSIANGILKPYDNKDVLLLKE